MTLLDFLDRHFDALARGGAFLLGSVVGLLLLRGFFRTVGR